MSSSGVIAARLSGGLPRRRQGRRRAGERSSPEAGDPAEPQLPADTGGVAGLESYRGQRWAGPGPL